jgi:hypothetical protein
VIDTVLVGVLVPDVESVTTPADMVTASTARIYALVSSSHFVHSSLVMNAVLIYG